MGKRHHRSDDKGSRKGSKKKGSSKHNEHRHFRSSKGIRKLKGTFQKNAKGFGFIALEREGLEDLFVPPRATRSFFHGDRIEVTINSQGEILEHKVLSHAYDEIVGRYDRSGWVIFERRKFREEIPVPALPIQIDRRIEDQDWVRVKLHFGSGKGAVVKGEILEIFGSELPASADVGMIASEFRLKELHSAAAVEEAKKYAREGIQLESELDGRGQPIRQDLRHIPFITIDGETARDFDDAVYVEREKSGYNLWVGIADVSHYVREGTALDDEARERGTSVYFPERAFHMLPSALSEGVCSLKPNEPRMALVAKMFVDRNGVRSECEIIEALIQSRRRATYTEIQKEWNERHKDSSWEFAPHFALFAAFKKRRVEQGGLDFDFPEAEIDVAPTGEVRSIGKRQRWDSHRLIEEFMIAANEAVTEWALKRAWPFVYRIHDEPSVDALEAFQKLSKTVGFGFSLSRGATPKQLAEFLGKLKGHVAEGMLSMALLRSLKQAKYSATHGGHYGLASDAYTHFTSPIRRYPDLVVHRLLRQALRCEKGIEKKPKAADLGAMEERLADVAEHCSIRERLASDAERESIRMKQVRLMSKSLGEEFDGAVIGITKNGLFIEISAPFVEGFLPFDSIKEDAYQFREDRMNAVGRSTKRVIHIGDKFRIQVVRTDIERRMIEFGPAAELAKPRQILPN